MPRLNSPPLYHVDPSGARWRVHDVRFGPPHCAPHRTSRQAPGDPHANYRAFVAVTGDVWSYRFRADESRRDLTAATLERQRQAAGWTPRRPSPPHDPDPGRACSGPTFGGHVARPRASRG